MKVDIAFIAKFFSRKFAVAGFASWGILQIVAESTPQNADVSIAAVVALACIAAIYHIIQGREDISKPGADDAAN